MSVPWMIHDGPAFRNPYQPLHGCLWCYRTRARWHKTASRGPRDPSRRPPGHITPMPPELNQALPARDTNPKPRHQSCEESPLAPRAAHPSLACACPLRVAPLRAEAWNLRSRKRLSQQTLNGTGRGNPVEKIGEIAKSALDISTEANIRLPSISIPAAHLLIHG